MKKLYKKGCPYCGGTEDDFGVFQNSNKILTVMPDEWETARRSRFFSIDSCLASELNMLWKKGVRTQESCCGHGKGLSYIAVDEKSIPIMESLGYTYDYTRPRSWGIFFTKTAYFPWYKRLFYWWKYRVRKYQDECVIDTSSE